MNRTTELRIARREREIIAEMEADIESAVIRARRRIDALHPTKQASRRFPVIPYPGRVGGAPIPLASIRRRRRAPPPPSR